MSNLLEPRLLDIDEAAEMLQCSVAKVRQMVIEDRTLAAVHVARMGFRKPFEFRGLQVFAVDDLGVIFDRGRGREPAGFLRFAFAEVARVLSKRAHSEANAVPLSELFPPAPSAPVESDSTTPSPEPVGKTKAKRRTWLDVSSPYIVEVMRAGQYATCKELYRALDRKAGPDSPFDRGTGANINSLFVRETAQTLNLKTVQNNWPTLRELEQR